MQSKTIFTSNYARNGRNPNAYGISYKRSRWYSGKMIFELAPEPKIVIAIKSGEIDEREYIEEYLRTLRARDLTPEKAVKLIPDDAVLLCFESPKDFCHRRVLAQWIKRGVGLEIPEIKTPKEQVQGQTLHQVDHYIY